ncbi:MAG: hypothetical protein R3F39_11705 [Myxococcota bacterium]
MSTTLSQLADRDVVDVDGEGACFGVEGAGKRDLQHGLNRLVGYAIVLDADAGVNWPGTISAGLACPTGCRRTA